MDEDAEKRVRAKRSGDRIGDLDRLSNFPDELLCQVLLNLPTKDVVKSSVLSSRWRNLWLSVPGLDLDNRDFPNCNAFVRFVDRFLGFNNESCLQNYILKQEPLEKEYDWEWDWYDVDHVTGWINTVLKRKVQHLHLLDTNWWDCELEIPPTLYTCESLVTLKLRDVVLLHPKSVSLPSVKVIDLQWVTFANDWAFEMLISGCPVLESLTLRRTSCDYVKVLRVCSQSLLSFTYVGDGDDDTEEDLVVAIDAPRLEYLKLSDDETSSFIINNLGSLVKVDMDITFNLSSKNRFDPNDLPKRYMIRNFLLGISRVEDMIISSHTLEVIYNYSRCEPLPLFRNLSFLHARFSDYRWEMLPIFLESFPNLKSLSLGFSRNLGEERIGILHGPHHFLPSLEFVEIVKPMGEEATEMKLVSYFLENSKILKKFTLRLDSFREKEESAYLKKLLTIPRLSSACQVVVL